MRSKTMCRAMSSAMLTGGLVLGLTGCGGSDGRTGICTVDCPVMPTGVLAAGGAASVYVIQSGNGFGDSILEFAAGSAQNATPIGTLTIRRDIKVYSVATDSLGQIYIGGVQVKGSVQVAGEILVYAAGATGDATPVRTIFPESGTNLLFDSMDMAVDASGQIYVTGVPDGIAVFAAGANGAATPTRLIASGQLDGAIGLAVDATGEIFVSTETAGSVAGSTTGQILVYAAGANGSDAPVRVLTPPAGTATTNNFFLGLAVGPFGELYAAYDTETHDGSNNVTATSLEVQEFAAGASGAATPIKTISGAATGLTFGYDLQVDSVGNVYVVNVVGPDSSSATNSVLGFGPNANGNVAPGLTLISNSWSLPGFALAVH
jgi:hypothetical protein